jgi:hypothetical protein
MGFIPQALRDLEWIDVSIHGLPPFDFIAGPVQLTVMGPAQRHRELVTDLSPQGAGLGKSQMMRVRGFAIAEQAGLRSHKLQMCFVAAARRVSGATLRPSI